MREISSGIYDGPLSPDGALKEAHDLAKRVVSLSATEAGTKEAAVYSLSRRYGFGSWLKRLARGDKVTVHLHLYRRLCRALETVVAEQEHRLARDRAALAAIEASHAVVESSRPADPRPRKEDRRPRLHLASAS